MDITLYGRRKNSFTVHALVNSHLALCGRHGPWILLTEKGRSSFTMCIGCKKAS